MPRRVQIGANRSRTGTVAAAVAGYFGSASFAMGLADSTRRTRRRILERFREQHGDKGIATLGKVHVERMVNAKAGTPGEALNFLVALRTLMRHAITAGLRADDPTIGVRAPKYRSAGFYTWTEDGHCGVRGEAYQAAAGRGLHLRCCCTRLSAEQMSCEWAVSTSATAC